MTPRSPPEDNEYVAESSKRRKKVAWNDDVQTIPGNVRESGDSALLDAAQLSNPTTTPHFFAVTHSRSTHTPPPAQQAPQAVRSAVVSSISYGHDATNQTPGSTSMPYTSAAVRRQEPPGRLLPTHSPAHNLGYQAPIHTENSPSYLSNTSTSSPSPSTPPISSSRHNRTQSSIAAPQTAQTTYTAQPSRATTGESPPGEPRLRLIELPAVEAPDEPIPTAATSHYASSSHGPSYTDRSSSKSKDADGGTRTQTPTVSNPATQATVLPKPHIHDLLRANNEGLVKWDVRVNPEVALGELPWKQLAKLAIEPSMSHTSISIAGVAGEMVFKLSSSRARKGLTVQAVLSGIYDGLHTRVSIDDFKEILPTERQLVENASKNRCRYFHPEDVSTDGRTTIRRVDFIRDYMFGGLVLLEGTSRVGLKVESDSDK